MYVNDLNERTLTRLNELLTINARNEQLRLAFKTDAERWQYLQMRVPLNNEHAFAALGGFLGTFAPAAIYLKIHFWNEGSLGWFLALFVVANMITAFAGYYLGAFVGKLVRAAERWDWITMTFVLMFVGGAWGFLSGFVGGLAILIIGALLGAVIGAVVGAVSLPAFAILHRLLATAGYIDRRTLVPIAAGTSLVVAAFIFGS